MLTCNINCARRVVTVVTKMGHDSLKSAPVDWNRRSSDVFAGVPCQPPDQAGNRGRLYPLGNVCARHVFSVGGSVHGSGENYVCGNAGVFIFQRDGSDQRYQRCLRSAVGSNLGAGIFGGTAANGNDAASTSLAESPRAECEKRCQVRVKHALPNGVVHFSDSLAARETAD